MMEDFGDENSRSNSFKFSSDDNLTNNLEIVDDDDFINFVVSLNETSSSEDVPYMEDLVNVNIDHTRREEFATFLEKVAARLPPGNV
jgi:hypothetical protein